MMHTQVLYVCHFTQRHPASVTTASNIVVTTKYVLKDCLSTWLAQILSLSLSLYIYIYIYGCRNVISCLLFILFLQLFHLVKQVHRFSRDTCVSVN